MSEQLFKAKSRHAIAEDVRNNLRLHKTLYGTTYIAQSLEGATRDSWLNAAQAKLAEEGREEHLLNLYLSIDDDLRYIDCVWTFSDRNTALMFKLSLW